jgi:hypothetical protein
MNARKTRRSALLSAVGVAIALAALAGCDALYSDSENALRHRQAERQDRVASMQAASTGAITLLDHS